MGPERYGHVRGYGIGVIPTQLSAVSRYTQDARQGTSTAEVCSLKTEMVQIKQSYETRIEEMRQSHMTDMAELKQSQELKIQSLQDQLDHISSFLQRFAPPVHN